jgi:hypothetical protein
MLCKRNETIPARSAEFGPDFRELAHLCMSYLERISYECAAFFGPCLAGLSRHREGFST